MFAGKKKLFEACRPYLVRISTRLYT